MNYLLTFLLITLGISNITATKVDEYPLDSYVPNLAIKADLFYTYPTTIKEE
jgi:hypothetical protein